jgi:putative RNA 2'-phosphotransferase
VERWAEIRASKFLSLVLRHKPGAAGVSLDPEGWAPVADLLAGCERAGITLTVDELRSLVARSDKQRFALSPDGLRIRANQGHSIAVDLGLSPMAPPPVLFHGTVDRFLPSIRNDGLLRGKRHAVHLSPTRDIATAVGGRRGRPVVLEVDAARMSGDGHVFFQSQNGVWLTDRVPPDYIRFPEHE